ncbi:hypothetical protein DN062_13645 [Nitrincola tibetensis]|uniref:Uncharacterized protein n=1 Tax=Nitrincola tibetensis TaxID=2219697 RepID=A0A364NJV3_9GAMM|nr:hypothetical protein DN062_13645 [Nitrincola tibetensis]
MNYKHAIVKTEGPVATLFCNGCGVEISQSTKHEDRQHFCIMCMSGNCKTKFKAELPGDHKFKDTTSKTCA